MILALTTESINALVRSLGGVGLLAVTFADSSFVSIAGVADLLMILLSIRHRDRMLYYAAMATIGSVGGCFTAYLLTRKAGDTFLRRRFSAQKIDRALGRFKRYGSLAIIIPALLPPPAPFQIFVLLAGVADMSPWTFGFSVVLGRGVRYFGEGLLALYYGRQVIGMLDAHRLAMIIGTSSLVVLGGLSWLVWTRMRRARG